jgi:hypothetical protein
MLSRSPMPTQSACGGRARTLASLLRKPHAVRLDGAAAPISLAIVPPACIYGRAGCAKRALAARHGCPRRPSLAKVRTTWVPRMATRSLPLPKQLALFAGTARRLGPFLRDRLTPERCTEMSRRGLARREESFLNILDRALGAGRGQPLQQAPEARRHRAARRARVRPAGRSGAHARDAPRERRLRQRRRVQGPGPDPPRQPQRRRGLARLRQPAGPAPHRDPGRRFALDRDPAVHRPRPGRARRRLRAPPDGHVRPPRPPAVRLVLGAALPERDERGAALRQAGLRAAALVRAVGPLAQGAHLAARAADAPHAAHDPTQPGSPSPGRRPSSQPPPGSTRSGSPRIGPRR